ncbi:MAG: DNA repair protein RecN [Candidatus Phosphoribacter sp.]|nr:DNA repair protein RecN [Actinomycetales bacterium]
MLHELRIRDLGVIDEALLRLHPGLTVLSGETGAGKSMVVQGLGLLLGARADSGLVRAGRPLLAVEGIIGVPPGHPALARAHDAGGEIDDGELVLARTVSAQGRSRAHVGGRTAPVSVLAELGELLVAVHGQADQWRLRRGDEHRDVLDGFGGAAVAEARTAYEQSYAALSTARTERDRLAVLDRDRAREVDSLTAALEHLERVNPAPGEDAALRAEDERLAHAEALREAVGTAHSLLLGAGDEYGADEVVAAVDLIGRARAALGAVLHHDAQVADLDGRLADVGYQLIDLGGDLGGYLADLDADPSRLAWVQQRRADLLALTRRYGESVDEVLNWGQQAAARLDVLLSADARLATIEAELNGLAAAVTRDASALTEQRRSAARRFESAVGAELSHLAMGSARIQVALTAREPGQNGAEDVEIQLAANSGQAARSVAKAASGGELSRLMLAIEVVTSPQPHPSSPDAGSPQPPSSPALPTFVFDEVDAGVGGRAALDVGARLAALAQHAQVIVVTHLAQVAAYADRHLVVRKDDDGTVSASSVIEVDGDERLRELARMMGGGQSDAGLEHARELLASARGIPRGQARTGDATRRADATAP